ncbi:MAG: arginine--tRNA ligase [Phycisphaerae bacterium]
MNVRAELDSRISAALAAAGAPEDSPALVAPAARPEFGDYQANGVMPAAKRLKTNPRQLAEKVVAAADLGDLAESVEVAGPGFINIRLRDDWLAAELTRLAADERLGVPAPARRDTVVVDYSHPNLAKEMHVGHLRSTIIGDAIARTLEFLGHTVIRQNHVGDWGTQFGMLTAYVEESGVSFTRHVRGETVVTVGGGPGIEDMEEFYRRAKERFDGDPEFAEKARQYVVRLQGGDPDVRALWEFVVAQSLGHAERVYSRLGAKLTREDVRGESAYNDDLPKVVEDLDAAGLLSESQGARCVFLEELRGKDGEITPVIVQKSDGGYLYATTDLAAVRYRANVLKADRILYIVDARQTLHLRQVFAVARAAKFCREACSLEHHAFGTMMGADGRPFKTREGGTVKLMDLLDEAQERAFALVSEKNPDLPEDRRRRIGRVVGIGAVKYADLAQNRSSDYVFSWEKMLSLEGNTAPYMQYAYARIRSIFRRGELERPEASGEVSLGHPAERTLAVKLAQFPETVEAVARECLPNLLCGYLFELAGAFMGFYESCPVLKAGDARTRTSRLMLCRLTAATIRTGLGLLGIETIEQM